MNLLRNEIRTGLFVVVTIGLVAAILIYYGAAGDFSDRKRFQVYFDDAGGIQPGATVTLSGRKVGQVRRLMSPVPEAERPEPQLQVVIEVEVSITARIYRDSQVLMLQYGMLGDQLIDFTNGRESAGVAPDGSHFIGRRQPGLGDAIPALLERIDPLVNESTALVKELRTTAAHLSRITADDSDFNQAIARYKDAGSNLKKLTSDGGHLSRTLKNLDELTGPGGRASKTFDTIDLLIGKDGDLAAALLNMKEFTASLNGNKDIAPTLANFRRASEQLNSTMGSLNGTVKRITPCVNETVRNAAQFTDTIKRQPWRLIWPSTKKYPEDDKKKKQNFVVMRKEEIFLPVGEKPRRPLWASDRQENAKPQPPEKQEERKKRKERKERKARPPGRPPR